jgi:hypothetical protein
MARAEAAGKSEQISLVTVNITEIKSLLSRLLARMISFMSSTTASCIKPASSRSIWVAPLIARSFICEFYFLRPFPRWKLISRLMYLSIKQF